MCNLNRLVLPVTCCLDSVLQTLLHVDALMIMSCHVHAHDADDGANREGYSQTLTALSGGKSTRMTHKLLVYAVGGCRAHWVRQVHPDDGTLPHCGALGGMHCNRRHLHKQHWLGRPAISAGLGPPGMLQALAAARLAACPALDQFLHMIAIHCRFKPTTVHV